MRVRRRQRRAALHPPEVIGAAIKEAGVGSFAEAVDELSKAGADSERRFRVAAVLAFAPPSQFGRRLIELLSHPDEAIISGAIMALGKMECRRATRAICILAKRAASEEVLQYCIYALQAIRDKRAARTLAEIALSDARTQASRCLAAEAIGYLRPMRSAMVKALGKLSRTADPAVRYSALCGLEHSGSKLSMLAIRDLLNDRDQVDLRYSTIGDRAREVLDQGL